MELNELKKLLYRTKPIAKIESVTKDLITYRCEVGDMFIYFLVPIDDIGDATFGNEVQSQLLIRYLNY